MSKSIFVRTSGEPDRKNRKEVLEEKRRINTACMEVRLSTKSTKEALVKAHKAGLTNRSGGKLSPSALMYRCQWALIDNPDYWRDRIDAYDRKSWQPAFTDDEWEEHVIDNCIDFAKYSSSHVYRLILSDTARWGRWQFKWADNPNFAGLGPLGGQMSKARQMSVELDA